VVRQPPDFDKPPEERAFTSFDKLRMLLEVMFFGWIIPTAGRYKGRGKTPRSSGPRPGGGRGPGPLSSRTLCTQTDENKP